ncbi:hypothetical protein D918_01710 [Trichuris suis]|nr:hypothetical protein D918_01710 [Trichuris suis]
MLHFTDLCLGELQVTEQGKNVAVVFGRTPEEAANEVNAAELSQFECSLLMAPLKQPSENYAVRATEDEMCTVRRTDAL